VQMFYVVWCMNVAYTAYTCFMTVLCTWCASTMGCAHVAWMFCVVSGILYECYVYLACMSCEYCINLYMFVWIWYACFIKYVVCVLCICYMNVLYMACVFWIIDVCMCYICCKNVKCMLCSCFTHVLYML